MTAHEQLERLAIDAHTRGDTWTAWWPSVAEQVRAAEPWNRGRYRRLVGRLLALVASGDVDGQRPVGADLEPWEADDAKPADTGTAARIDWQAAGIAEPTRQGRGDRGVKSSRVNGRRPLCSLEKKLAAAKNIGGQCERRSD